MSFPVRFRQALCGLLGALLIGICHSAHASFSLTFQGLVRTVNLGNITLSSPAAIVVDPAGNLFVLDTGNNRIVQINAQGVASVLTVSGLSPALSSPSGIALDGAGNLYIADTGNSRLVKVTNAGVASVVSTGSVILSSPRGVALDMSGDIFIADTGNNRIAEVTSGGSAAALTITVSSGSSTLSNPKGLAVSNRGKLYIADSGNNRIVTVASGSTTGIVQSILGGVTLSNPGSVMVDSIGNVYVADTGNDRIAEVDTSGNGTVLYTDSMTLSGPLGLAVDPFGTVYIADTADSRVLNVAPPVNGDLEPGSQTYSLNQSVVGFGHAPLGSSSAVALTLPFTTGGVGLGAVKVFAFGTQSLDFTAGPDTTCNSSTAASTFCSVEINYLPTGPGLRSGAVVLYDTSQNPILTIPLYGFADSPVAGLGPNVGARISTGSQVTSNPYQIALDGAGNMYVGDYTGKNVVQVPAGGGSATLVSFGTPGTPATALQNITGVALDGAGNLFVGDHQNSRILVKTPGGVVSVLSISGLSPSLGFPTALAFDLAGNLYIADFTQGRVVKVSSLVVAGSTSSGLATVIGTGSYSFTGSTLTGMTVDLQGNIYLAARTQNSSSIIRVSPAGVASVLPTPGLSPALSNPQGVGVDAMGNVYVVDTANSRIVRITNAGLVSAFSISGLTSPSNLSSLLFGVTVDSFGNLYISDWTNNRLVFVNVSGAALKFANTNTGSASSDSPKTATVTNLGNQSLAFSTNPTYTADFSNSSADMNPCTSSTSLLAGVACDVAVNFTPQSAGALSAGITVTDNTLNVEGSTQQISVSGTAISAGDTTSTTVTITPSSLTNGQTATITATVADTTSGHTSTVPTGSVTFTDTVGSSITSLNGGSAVTLSAGVATLTGVRLSGTGSHTISANYGGVNNTFKTSSNTAVATLGKASVTISGPATEVPIGQAGSVTVTVASSNTALAAPLGTLNYSLLNSSGTSVGSGEPALTAGSSSSTASIAIPNTLASGAYILSATYSGDSNYLATSTATAIQVTIGPSTPTIGLSSTLNPAMATTAVTFTAAVASSSGTPTGMVSFLDGTTLLGAVALSGGAAAFTSSSLAAGTHAMTAVYAGDANFASVTSSPLTEVIQDFRLSPSGSGSGTPTQTVLPGGTASYPLVFGPLSGTTFPNAVTLSVSGLPPGATATITPNILPAGSSLTDVTLTIQLPVTTAKLLSQRIPLVVWGVLLLPFAGRLRPAGQRMPRILSGLLLAAAALAVGAGLSGCGSTSSGFFGQAQQTYSVVITATSGSISHSTTVTLIVQ